MCLGGGAMGALKATYQFSGASWMLWKLWKLPEQTEFVDAYACANHPAFEPFDVKVADIYRYRKA